MCVSSASTDLRGGCRVTGIPTAISYRPTGAISFVSGGLVVLAVGNFGEPVLDKVHARRFLTRLRVRLFAHRLHETAVGRDVVS